MSCVYALSLASTPEDIRYIGRTFKTPTHRLTLHLRDSKKRKTHVHNWIQKSIEASIRRAEARRGLHL